MICAQKRASYNLKCLKPKFCKEYKTSEMIDVKHLKCELCSKRKTFNFSDKINARFCLEHKLYGMIDALKKDVYIKVVILDQLLIIKI